MNQSKVSVILPAHNEEEALREIVLSVQGALTENGITGEVIVVDDGSEDRTMEVAESLTKEISGLKVLSHRVNLGKTAAIETGIKGSTGDFVVFMDADLQYNPRDIPLFLKPFESGFDFVNGWRNFSKYPLRKRVPSKIYNFLARKMFKVNVHDMNCGYKAFRREVAKDFEFKPGYHRYFVGVAARKGYKICEVEVNLSGRRYGRSSFGWRRLIEGSLDLVSVWLLMIIARKPMLIFGLGGMTLSGIGFFLLLDLIASQIIYGVPLVLRPLLIISLILIVSGIQLFSMGLIAELFLSKRRQNSEHNS